MKSLAYIKVKCICDKTSYQKKILSQLQTLEQLQYSGFGMNKTKLETRELRKNSINDDVIYESIQNFGGYT